MGMMFQTEGATRRRDHQMDVLQHLQKESYHVDSIAHTTEGRIGSYCSYCPFETTVTISIPLVPSHCFSVFWQQEGPTVPDTNPSHFICQIWQAAAQLPGWVK